MVNARGALALTACLSVLGCNINESNVSVDQEHQEPAIQNAEMQTDPILVARLSNFPKTSPWPISWFEPKETIEGVSSAPEIKQRATPLVSEQAWAEATDWAQSIDTKALYVWKDGELDRRWTAEGFEQSELVNTYYLNYFVLVLLYGIALDDGAITSIDEPVGTYIKEWASSPEGDIPLRSLLQMHAGLELYKDSIEPEDKAAQMFFGGRTTEAALQYKIEHQPDEMFEYNYVVPEILGIALERATGRRYADLVSEKIWKPIGAADAAVWLDREGGRPHFNAALFAQSDAWLRLGAMIAQNGVFDGQQVVPASWIERMQEPSPTNPGYGMVWLSEPFVAERFLSPEVNYTVKATQPFTISNLMIFDGYGGQRLYVSTSEDLAIVRIGKVARKGWDDSYLPNLIASGLAD